MATRPVTATISALGIGIGIPYMIHVTHRYLEERVQQENEDVAIEQTLTYTGGALAGSALTTMAGFAGFLAHWWAADNGLPFGVAVLLALVGVAAGTLVITRGRDDRWVAYGCREPGK